MSKRNWIAGLTLINLTAAAAAAHAATKISEMYTASAPDVVSWVAKDQGFFAQHGVDVDMTLAANGSVVVSAVQSGSVQVGVPSPIVFLQAVDNGLDQMAIASTNAYPDPAKVGLVARAGIEITSPGDLVGKTIGVPGVGGFLDVVLHKWLADNKVDINKIRFVEVTLPQTGDALRSKQADVVASVSPFLARAIDSGAGTFAGNYTETLPNGTVASFYSVSKAWAIANPDAVKGFQEGLVDALAYIKSGEHDASVRESIGRYTKLPPDVVAHLVLPNVTVALSPEQMAFWIDLGKQQGLISNPIDPKSVIIPLPKP